MKRKLLAIFFSTVFVCSATFPVFFGSSHEFRSDRYEKQDSKLKLGEVQESISYKKNQKSALENRLQNLNTQYSALAEEMESLNSQAAENEQSLKALQAELDKAKTQSDEQESAGLDQTRIVEKINTVLVEKDSIEAAIRECSQTQGEVKALLTVTEKSIEEYASQINADEVRAAALSAEINETESGTPDIVQETETAEAVGTSYENDVQDPDQEDVGYISEVSEAFASESYVPEIVAPEDTVSENTGILLLSGGYDNSGDDTEDFEETYEETYEESYEESYEDYEESYEDDEDSYDYEVDFDEDSYEDYEESYEDDEESYEDYEYSYEDYDYSYEDFYEDLYEDIYEEYGYSFEDLYEEEEESYEDYEESYEDYEESYEEYEDSYEEEEESYEEYEESYEDYEDSYEEEEESYEDYEDSYEEEEESYEDDDDEYVDSSAGTYLGTFTLTAYCDCAICCGTAGNQTASGTWPTAGTTVAMGGVPFGTQLLINGHVYTVEDRGTPYGHVDIFFDSHEEALQFGLQSAEVYQLN